MAAQAARLPRRRRRRVSSPPVVAAVGVGAAVPVAAAAPGAAAPPPARLPTASTTATDGPPASERLIPGRLPGGRKHTAPPARSPKRPPPIPSVIRPAAPTSPPPRREPKRRPPPLRIAKVPPAPRFPGIPVAEEPPEFRPPRPVRRPRPEPPAPEQRLPPLRIISRPARVSGVAPTPEGQARPENAPSGFKSKAQWRFFFSRGERDPRWARWAHEKAHATAGGPVVRYRRLPPRKRAPGPRAIR